MQDYIKMACLSFDFFDYDKNDVLSEDPFEWPKIEQEEFFELVVSKMEPDGKTETIVALAALCAEKNMNPFSLKNDDIFGEIIAPYLFNRDNVKVIKHYRDSYIADNYGGDDSNVMRLSDYQQRVRDCRGI
jgi:hypothetical protein